MGTQAADRRFKHLTRELDRAARNEALDNAITELEQMHAALQPKCRDDGPETCPTWGAIRGLRWLRGGRFA